MAPEKALFLPFVFTEVFGFIGFLFSQDCRHHFFLMDGDNH